MGIFHGGSLPLADLLKPIPDAEDAAAEQPHCGRSIHPRWPEIVFRYSQYCQYSPQTIMPVTLEAR